MVIRSGKFPEEFSEQFPYMLVAETFTREIHRTFRGKRLFYEMFPTESERKRVMELVKQSKDYAFKHGVPYTVKMLTRTAQLWNKLAQYCMEVG